MLLNVWLEPYKRDIKTINKFKKDIKTISKFWKMILQFIILGGTSAWVAYDCLLGETKEHAGMFDFFDNFLIMA